MKTKGFSGLKRATGASLDEGATKNMARCLEDLTSSGNPTLNETDLRKFKKFCRKSDDYVRYAFMLIMERLEKKHSEIRLSAFQVAAEIFTRSHAFREILITHLQEFLTLTIGVETDQPLPPPKPAANALKESAVRTVQQWYADFGKSYRKLDFGYNYLKNCKHIDFQNIIARNEADRLRAEQEKKRKEKQMADRLAKVMKVIVENKPEIEDCIKEADNCLKLLLPTPENFQLFTEEDAFEPHNSDRISNHSDPKIISPPSENSSSGEDDNDSTKTESEGNEIKNACNLDGNYSNNNSCELSDESKEVSHSDSKTKCSPSHVSQSNKSNEKRVIEEGDDLTSSVQECQTDHEDGMESGDEEGYNSDDIEDDRAHGFGNPGLSINIEIPVDNVSVKETEDNRDVFQSLKDAAKLINSIFLQRVTKWLEVLGKNGGVQSDIKSIIDLKVSMESIKTKCTELKMVFTGNPGDKDSDDDDDFEDVPEKEGYEATIPTQVRPLVDEGPSSSKGVAEKPGLKRHHTSDASTSSDSKNVSSIKKSKSFTSSWKLKDREDDSLSDPTSFASALARIQSSSSSDDIKPSTSSYKSSSPKEESSKSSVPFVEFGTELAHWENIDNIEAPEIVKLESLHGFWAPFEKDSEGTTKQHIQLMLNRTYKFTGEFEPVKWSCRAPLQNGKLCPRMDRVKCPFHGRIIPRDEAGNPSVKDEPGTSTVTTTSQVEAEENSELPPWRDPQLQREIEQTTGHDLGSAHSQKLLDKASGKGKGKGKKKRGLTDIKAVSNTSRSRLEKKVFDKQALRRICTSLDRSDYKRVRDKFGNQFNYNGR